MFKSTNIKDNFCRRDTEVINTKTHLKTLEIHPYCQKSEWHILLMTKAPLYDEVSNEVIGICGYYVNVTTAFSELDYIL